MPNLHIRSGSPAPRLSFTSSICLAASGAGSETLKHSVHAGRTQPERVELSRSGVARGIPATQVHGADRARRDSNLVLANAALEGGESPRTPLVDQKPLW